MCFNAKYSATFAALGALATYWAYTSKDTSKSVGHNLLYIPLAFYTFMEILQTVQYSYVNECDSMNQFLTEISYVLILVQPIMWNLIFLFKKRSISLLGSHRGILICAIALCAVWILAHVFRRFQWYGHKNHVGEEIVSGKKTCTYKNDGEHLYWNYELFSNPGMDANWFMYLALWFIPGLLIPGEGLTILTLVGGFLASWAYVRYKNQTSHIIPSLWCLSSAPTLILNVAYAYFAM